MSDAERKMRVVRGEVILQVHHLLRRGNRPASGKKTCPKFFSHDWHDTTILLIWKYFLCKCATGDSWQFDNFRTEAGCE